MANLLVTEKLNNEALAKVSSNLTNVSRLFSANFDEQKQQYKRLSANILEQRRKDREQVVFAQNKIVPIQREEQQVQQTQKAMSGVGGKVSIKDILGIASTAGSIASIAAAATGPLIGAFVSSLPVLLAIAGVGALGFAAYNSGLFRKREPEKIDDGVPYEGPAPDTTPPDRSVTPQPSPGQTGPGTLVFPLPKGSYKGQKGQKFGDSRDGGARKHAGIDITENAPWARDPRIPVVAMMSGVVLNEKFQQSGYLSGCIIRGDDGYDVRYLHMTPSVKPGQRVNSGQQIGRLVDLKNSTHLHLELYKGNSGPIDPTSYVSRAGKAPGRPPAQQQPRRAPGASKRPGNGKVRPIAIFAGHADAPYKHSAPGTGGTVTNDYQPYKKIGTPITREQYLTPLTGQLLANQLNSRGLPAKFFQPKTPLSMDDLGPNSNWKIGADLFKSGYQVYEIHFDSPGGKGGLIQRRSSTLKSVPEDPVEKNINKYGKSFGRGHGRGGGALSRGINLLEVSGMNQTLVKAVDGGQAKAKSAVAPYAKQIASIAASGLGGPTQEEQGTTLIAPEVKLNTLQNRNYPVGSSLGGITKKVLRKLSKMIR